MRSYVPNTASERAEMLKAIGVDSMEALFSDIPERLRVKGGLKLGKGLSEHEVRRVFKAYAKDVDADMPLFRGAGAYRHYIPSAIPQLAMRSELFTAYTPYQAEMSQGMLQSLFEYQTLVCELTGLDASNASVYDGATAAAESMLMMRDAKRKQKILASAGLLPDTLEVLKTYSRFAGLELIIVPLDTNGVTDKAALKANIAGAAGYIAANPNFFGCLEDMQAISDIVHEAGALLTAYVNPITLGLVKRPGEYGADIAVGDAQPLGLPLSFGGPYCGFMCASKKLMRNLPGRIAGETADKDGNRVFVLTLQAREQHIRRDKAASNICSNQMLCAVMAAMYLGIMGPNGMREVANQNLQKAHYLHEGIRNLKGAKLRYENTPFFNEFTVEFEKSAIVINAALRDRGYVGGVRIGHYDKTDNGLIMCATEMNSRSEIDGFLAALEEVLK